MSPFKHFAVVLCAAPCIAASAPLTTIIGAMSIPVAAPQTQSDWGVLSKVDGVRWYWPASKAGEHDNTMSGKLRIEGVGVAAAEVIGSRTSLWAIQIVSPVADLEMSIFGKIAASRLSTSCDEDSGGYKVAFYRITQPGFKPLFIAHTSSQGAGGAGETSFTVAHDFADAAADFDLDCAIKR